MPLSVSVCHAFWFVSDGCNARTGYLFIRVVQLHPQPRLSLQDGGGYKTIPRLSEAGSVRLAWALIVISLLGNAVAIVFTAATGGLAWQS